MNTDSHPGVMKVLSVPLVGLLVFTSPLPTASVVAQVKLKEATLHGRVYVDSMTVSTSNLEATVHEDGRVRGRRNGNRFAFRLPTNEDTSFLTKLYWAETDSTIILTYIESQTTEGASYLSIIHKSPVSVLDRAYVGGFNLQPPVFRDENLYLRAIGTIAKYNLSTLRFEWQHTDLYNRARGTYNGFSDPSFQEGKVILISEDHHPPDTLIIDDATGHILQRQ